MAIDAGASTGTFVAGPSTPRAKRPVTHRLRLSQRRLPLGLASGTTITATFSVAVDGRAIGGFHFTGVETASALDTTPSPNGQTVATLTSNSLTTANAGEVVIGFSHMEAQRTSTPTSPSLEALDWNSASTLSWTLCYRIEASPSSYTFAGTWRGGTNVVAVAAADKAAAVAAVGYQQIRPLLPRLMLGRRPGKGSSASPLQILHPGCRWERLRKGRLSNRWDTGLW
jgi:hypothetical protein